MTEASYLDKSVTEWIAVLGHKDVLMRRLATHALSEMGPSAQSAVPVLKKHLEDPQPHLRVWVAAAIAHISPGSQEAMDTLVAALNADQPFVRSLATWQLGRLGPRYPGIETAVPLISQGLDDDDASVSSETASTLKKLRGTRRDFPQP